MQPRQGLAAGSRGKDRLPAVPVLQDLLGAALGDSELVQGLVRGTVLFLLGLGADAVLEPPWTTAGLAQGQSQAAEGFGSRGNFQISSSVP